MNYAERYSKIRKRISKAVLDTLLMTQTVKIDGRMYLVTIMRGDIDFDTETHLTVIACDNLLDMMRAYARGEASVDIVKIAWKDYVHACRVVIIDGIPRYEPSVTEFEQMQATFSLPTGERVHRPNGETMAKRPRDTQTFDMFAPVDAAPVETPAKAPVETLSEDALGRETVADAQTVELVATDASCAKDTAASEVLSESSAAPVAVEREQEPSRTAKAVQERKLDEWRTQDLDGESCPHGFVLKLETCNKGCSELVELPADEVETLVDDETSELAVEAALTDDAAAEAAAQVDDDGTQNALFEYAAETVDRVQIFSDDTMIDKALVWHRARGFPYRDLSPAICMQQINELSRTEGKALIHSTAAYQVADTYHHHRMHAAATGKKTPLEAFDDDKKLRHAIELELKWSKLPRVFAGGHLTMVLGTQACSNFRPGFAVYLYREFAPDNAVVLDTSTGYGGRLVGAVASQKVSRYIGIDPNKPTHEANLRMAADLGFDHLIELYNQPAEDVEHVLLADRCDFAFTSPPYFAKERYSYDDTQSWVRYKTADQWRKGFLKKMLELTYVALKAGSFAIVNIAAVTIKEKKYPLDEWTKDDAVALGFKYIRTEQFPMTARFGAHQDEAVAIEPVLVFQKEG